MSEGRRGGGARIIRKANATSCGIADEIQMQAPGMETVSQNYTDDEMKHGCWLADRVLCLCVTFAYVSTSFSLKSAERSTICNGECTLTKRSHMDAERTDSVVVTINCLHISLISLRTPVLKDIK